MSEARNLVVELLTVTPARQLPSRLSALVEAANEVESCWSSTYRIIASPVTTHTERLQLIHSLDARMSILARALLAECGRDA